jgi:co-chaperonin GroES (HSP10)
MAQYKPQGDRATIRPDIIPEFTESGIKIPPEKPCWGEVIDIGESVEELKPKDRVVFPAGAGVELDGILIIREGDCDYHE